MEQATLDGFESTERFTIVPPSNGLVNARNRKHRELEKYALALVDLLTKIVGAAEAAT
jgi:hypothetical protein